MNNLHEIGKNRIFKIVGIAVVLYLIFFSKKNPDSITNRVSIEEIKKGAHDIKEKTDFIKTNLKAAKEATKENVTEKSATENVAAESATTSQQALPDEVDENYKIACGDEIEVSYTMLLKGKDIGGMPQHEKLIVGKNSNYVIEHDVIGMKKGEVKTIPVPEKVTTKNGKVIVSKTSTMAYQITVESIKKATQSAIVCY